MSIVRRMTLLSLGAVAAAAVAYAQDTGVVLPENPGFFVLQDPLDEAEDGEYYCLDVFNSEVVEGAGMQAHTCKDRPSPPEDQTFTANSPNLGQIQVTEVTEMDLCVTMHPTTLLGSRLSVRACDAEGDDPRQLWISDESGQIHPQQDTSLCLTVQTGVHGQCGNPDCSNYKRSLSLQTCADQRTRFISWWAPGGSVGL